MRIPGFKKIKHSARWVRSRFSNGALILGYHRISENSNDVYSTCVSPHHFAEHMEVLRQSANPIRLDDLITGLKTGKLPPKAVTVTFDDGYADNLYKAKPLLDKYEIPFTLFVASGYLGRRFWWDDLACLLLDDHNLPSALKYQIAGKPITWQVPGGHNRHLLLQGIYNDLLELYPEDLHQVMENLAKQISKPTREMNCSRALTPNELVDFSKDELIAIGAHTVTHPFLANLPRDSQRWEIEKSKQDLEVLLGRPVTAFSYPNGSNNETTRSLLRETGFTSACASYNDVARKNMDPLNLPRFWVPDQNGSEFSIWLLRWLST